VDSKSVGHIHNSRIRATPSALDIHKPAAHIEPVDRIDTTERIDPVGRIDPVRRIDTTVHRRPRLRKRRCKQLLLLTFS